MQSINGITFEPLKLGVQIRDLDLTTIGEQAELKQLIIEGTHKHRLLVFRNQHHLTPEDQVRITRWFGEIDSPKYGHHPRAPLREIFRASNDANEGRTNAGRHGWHIDGHWRRAGPTPIVTYHMVNVPSRAGTRFVDLSCVWRSLTSGQQHRLNQLWVACARPGWVCGAIADEVPSKHVVRKLVYEHPITQRTTLLLSIGFSSCFIEHYQSANQRVLPAAEHKALVHELHNAIVSNEEQLVYHHKWSPGDFLISDNLAIAHEADCWATASVEHIGLRVLHRCSTKAVKHQLL